MQETQEMGIRSFGWKDPLEKEMTTHSNILTWKIPWTEDPGGLQALGVTRELDTTEHPSIQRILIPNLWNLS